MREVQQRCFVGCFFFVKTHHQKRIICPLDVAFKRNQLKVLQLCKVKFHIQPQRQNITRTSKQTGISSCASSAIYTGRVTGRRARAHAHTHAPTHYCFDFLPPCHTKWWMHSNCSGWACSLPWDVTNDLSVGLNKREKERFRPKHRFTRQLLLLLFLKRKDVYNIILKWASIMFDPLRSRQL